MKRVLLLGFMGIILYGCGGNQSETKKDESAGAAATSESADLSYDPEKGAGKFQNVQIDPKLNTQMAESGQKVYDVKCSSCHKLTDEKLVGPGWKDVTSRHKPEWIMNFVTNVDEMLAKDPKAQAQLEMCLVRMPNQNLSDDDARHVYEFMRKNDGVK